MASHEANARVARSRKLRYLAIPTILHWEDRATEWSGKPDRISDRLVFLDVVTGQTMDSAVMTAKSKWFTFRGDHPPDAAASDRDVHGTALPRGKRRVATSPAWGETSGSLRSRRQVGCK